MGHDEKVGLEESQRKGAKAQCRGEASELIQGEAGATNHGLRGTRGFRGRGLEPLSSNPPTAKDAKSAKEEGLFAFLALFAVISRLAITNGFRQFRGRDRSSILDIQALGRKTLLKKQDFSG